MVGRPATAIVGKDKETRLEGSIREQESRPSAAVSSFSRLSNVDHRRWRCALLCQWSFARSCSLSQQVPLGTGDPALREDALTRASARTQQATLCPTYVRDQVISSAAAARRREIPSRTTDPAQVDSAFTQAGAVATLCAVCVQDQVIISAAAKPRAIPVAPWVAALEFVCLHLPAQEPLFLVTAVAQRISNVACELWILLRSQKGHSASV